MSKLLLIKKGEMFPCVVSDIDPFSNIMRRASGKQSSGTMIFHSSDCLIEYKKHATMTLRQFCQQLTKQSLPMFPEQSFEEGWAVIERVWKRGKNYRFNALIRDRLVCNLSIDNIWSFHEFNSTFEETHFIYEH